MNFPIRFVTTISACAAAIAPAMAHPGHSANVVNAHTHLVDPAAMVIGVGAVVLAVGFWLLRQRSRG